MIIIACNTLGCHLNIDIEKPLYKVNECIVEELKKYKRKNKVLLLTTSLTKRSGYFQNECELLKINYDILSCPKLVSMVETSSFNFQEIKECLSEVIDNKYDVIVLGCTHFYYLEEYIRRIYPKAKIITGYNVLEKRIKKDLKKYQLKNNKKTGSSITVIRT
jgi:glutamate racemase